MSTDLSDTLDLMIERLNAGEDVFATMTSNPTQVEPLGPLLKVIPMLEVLRPVEMPPPETLAADRNQFLVELTRLQRQPVSPGPLVRLKEWIAHQIPQNPLQRKEQRRMSALLVKATLIISMAFGSAGGAAALAANSLPDSPLYPAGQAGHGADTPQSDNRSCRTGRAAYDHGRNTSAGDESPGLSRRCAGPGHPASTADSPEPGAPSGRPTA
jgi:hypothetical protein